MAKSRSRQVPDPTHKVNQARIGLAFNSFCWTVGLEGGRDRPRGEWSVPLARLGSQVPKPFALKGHPEGPPRTGIGKNYSVLEIVASSVTATEKASPEGTPAQCPPKSLPIPFPMAGAIGSPQNPSPHPLPCCRPVGFDSLWTSLRNNTSLTSLNVSRSDLGDSGMEPGVAPALPCRPLPSAPSSY